MPLPVIANTFRCALTWIDTGQTLSDAVNIIHVETAATATASAVATIIDNAIANVTTPVDLARQTNSAIVLKTVDVTPLDGSGMTAHKVLSTTVNGSGSTGVNPAQAVVLRIQTARRGRSYRGRIYLPYVCEAAGENGKIGSTPANAMLTAWADFANALTAQTPSTTLGVASYRLAHFEPSTNVVIETRLATQRRRQERVT